jgi:hypothetical protein
MIDSLSDLSILAFESLNCPLDSTTTKVRVLPHTYFTLLLLLIPMP